MRYLNGLQCEDLADAARKAVWLSVDEDSPVQVTIGDESYFDKMVVRLMEWGLVGTTREPGKLQAWGEVEGYPGCRPSEWVLHVIP